MIRGAALGVIVLTLLFASACIAQDAAGQQADEAALPNFGISAAPGEAVVDLADFVSSTLDASGTIPDLVQVRTSDGELRNLTAAEAFVLLARATYLWRTAGSLPQSVPISPGEISPPVLDSQDLVAAPTDSAVGREIPTEQFLSQCAAAVRWADRLRVIPTAIWVDGNRLSAAEYMAGLAICLSYAYWEDQLSDTIFLPAYAPPVSWVGETEAQSEATGHETFAEETSSAATESSYEEEASGYEEQAGEAASYGNESLAGEQQYDEQGLVNGDDQGSYGDGEWDSGESYEAEAFEPGTEEYVEPEIPPRMEITPEPGDEVRGVVDLIVSYSGPPASFVVFTIDGKGEVIMNSPPYSYRWNTASLKPGPHQVRIQVVGADDDTLLDQSNAYIVVAPPPKKSPGNVKTK